MKPEIILATATIIGALAIALANVLNNYKTNKTNLRLTQKTHEEEKKQAKLEKLEQLLRAVYALEEWTSRCRVTLFAVQSRKEFNEELAKITKSPIAEIGTLTTLYFSELGDSVTDIAKRHSKFTGEVIEIAKLCLASSKGPTDEQKKILDAHQEEFFRLYGVVVNKCENIMIKLDKW